MSTEEDLQDLPLPALFQRARATLKQLESLPASDPRVQQLVRQGTAVLRHAAHAVDALALFSANEDRDDLTTGDIKYLLIPFYQAEVLAHTQDAGATIGRAVQQQQRSRRRFGGGANE